MDISPLGMKRGVSAPYACACDETVSEKPSLERGVRCWPLQKGPVILPVAMRRSRKLRYSWPVGLEPAEGDDS